jgi:hypothetical protein
VYQGHRRRPQEPAHREAGLDVAVALLGPLPDQASVVAVEHVVEPVLVALSDGLTPARKREQLGRGAEVIVKGVVDRMGLIAPHR